MLSIKVVKKRRLLDVSTLTNRSYRIRIPKALGAKGKSPGPKKDERKSRSSGLECQRLTVAQIADWID